MFLVCHEVSQSGGPVTLGEESDCTSTVLNVWSPLMFLACLHVLAVKENAILQWILCGKRNFTSQWGMGQEDSD